jgi:hypothetical protein
MAKTVIKRLLVIGDNPDKKCAEYSADTKVEPYVRIKFADRHNLRAAQMQTLKSLLDSETIRLTEVQREVYKNQYLDAVEMDDEEFFEFATDGMEHDEETGDALSTENPKAKYKYQKCYDSQLKQTGEESDFSDPFKLKDGTKAYSARMCEIDWPRNHMYNTEIYRAAWEICVDGREPVNDTEKTIEKNMGNRQSYFANFNDVDEYIRHSCCFWTNCIITDDGKFAQLDYTVSDKKWISEFYDKYIKDLPDETLLTLYEVRSLND